MRLLLMTALVMPVLLLQLVNSATNARVELITEATSSPSTEKAALAAFFAVIVVAAEPAFRFFLAVEPTLLGGRRRVATTLYRATFSIRKPRVASILLAVLFIVDEVPALGKVSPEVLHDWATEA
jgi:hypothetical protein